MCLSRRIFCSKFRLTYDLRVQASHMKNINIVYSSQQCFSGRTEYCIRICGEEDRQGRGGAGHQGLRHSLSCIPVPYPCSVSYADDKAHV